MLQVVTQDRLADRLRVFLVLKLGRVDADDDQFIGPLLLELGQIRHDVDAVDAAERPEIKQNYLALEVLECERLARIEPGSAALQLWGLGQLARRVFVVFRLRFVLDLRLDQRGPERNDNTETEE